MTKSANQFNRDQYVQHYRLFFRNAESTNRLWRDAFGKRINPHRFRSCLATSTAVHHGAEIGLAMTVLDHKSSEVTERYYIAGQDLLGDRACRFAGLRRK